MHRNPAGLKSALESNKCGRLNESFAAAQLFLVLDHVGSQCWWSVASDLYRVSNHRERGVDAHPNPNHGFGTEYMQVRRHFACRRLCGSGDRAAENRNKAINKMVKKAELCDRYGVSQRTIENWMNSGSCPSVNRLTGSSIHLEACDKALEVHKNSRRQTI